MTKTVSLIASLTSSFIGRSVLVTDKAGTEARYTITKLDSKLGSLKDGSKGEYVILTKEGEAGVVLSLHPNTAKSLLTKGEADRLKLVEEVAVETAVEVKPAKAKKAAKAPKEPKAPKVKKAAAEKPEAAPKAPSKKALTLALYTKMIGEGKVRKEVIAAMKADLGLSAACSNTYFQNCKSGFWA